ncbi:MAG: cysteine desulfurase [Phycisphaeraceae bacterium]|nr:MAG: cysteine desulfurase [Phycisphaeraceae bacterium]
MNCVYLDSNATTRPAPEVVAAIDQALTDCWHNASSVHRMGQAARQRVELARQSAAKLINARPAEIVFTSGGTEAVELGIRGALLAAKAKARRVVISSKAEHSAVRELLMTLERRGEAEVRWVKLHRSGAVDLDSLRELLDESTALVSIQWANNETGTVQPVEKIGAMCREMGVAYHCDGVQWVGKAPTDVSNAPMDLLSFSAHKFHGPKGVGALWIRRGVRIMPPHPGAQEGGRRAGTENVPGMMGMGVAADLSARWLADPSNIERMTALRDRFEQRVMQRCPGAHVNGADAERLWNTSSIAFPRLEAEGLLIAMSERGLCASAGAACASGSLEPSPVLLAMGIPPESAHGSVRFSLSRETTDEEIDKAVEIIAACVERLKGSMASVG